MELSPESKASGGESQRFLQHRDIFSTEPDTAESDWYKHIRRVSILPTGDRDSNGHHSAFRVTPVRPTKVNHHTSETTFLDSWPWTIGVRDDIIYLPMFPELIDGRPTDAVGINTGNANISTHEKRDERHQLVRQFRRADKSQVTVVSGRRLDGFWADVEIEVPLKGHVCSKITLHPHPGHPDSGRSYHDMGTLTKQFGAATGTVLTADSILDKRTGDDEEEDKDPGFCSESYRLLNGDHGSQGSENEYDESLNQTRSPQGEPGYMKDHNEYTQRIEGRQVQMITLKMDGDRSNPPPIGTLTWYSRPWTGGEVTTRVDLQPSDWVGHEVERVQRL